MSENRRQMRSGFTLLETMIAVMLIAIAMVAVLASNTAFTQANGVAMRISEAEFLVEQMKAMTDSLVVVDPNSTTDIFGPEEASLDLYDDVDDFDGRSFNPPVDLTGSELSGLEYYTQQITVENVSHTNIQTVVADHSTDYVRVSVVVLFKGDEVASTSWLRCRK
jgi:prepilin-type N-terminal cleavage/methylation domain-containing protein